jgi:SET domain-containing protein
MTLERSPNLAVGANGAQARRAPVVVGPSLFVRGELGLIATKDLARGEIVLVIEGPTTSVRTRYTFQVGPAEHLDPRHIDGTPGHGHFLNHSCDPSAGLRINQTATAPRVEVVARRDIQASEELTFDYAATEYTTAAREIACQCGAARCRGNLKGYEDLPDHIRAQYQAEGFIPDYLSRLGESAS